MNKKQLLLLAAALIIILVAIGGIFYLKSFKTVRFDIQKKDIAITVHSDGSKIAALDKTGELRLQAGDYVVYTESENYDKTPISLKVEDNDKTIVINPSYSSAYREQILANESSAINSTLNSVYAAQVPNFTIDRGEIYKEGQWYATTLVQKTPSPSEQGDIYRTVLKKENGAWAVKAKPALSLSLREYPDIPFDILSDINAK